MALIPLSRISTFEYIITQVLATIYRGVGGLIVLLKLGKTVLRCPVLQFPETYSWRLNLMLNISGLCIEGGANNRSKNPFSDLQPRWVDGWLVLSIECLCPLCWIFDSFCEVTNPRNFSLFEEFFFIPGCLLSSQPCQPSRMCEESFTTSKLLLLEGTALDKTGIMRRFQEAKLQVFILSFQGFSKFSVIFRRLYPFLMSGRKNPAH